LQIVASFTTTLTYLSSDIESCGEEEDKEKAKLRKTDG
jgi:hypothetical protein